MSMDVKYLRNDKAFVLKIMKLDPRDRPTAKGLLKESWFQEK